jgi:hypothetical protein
MSKSKFRNPNYGGRRNEAAALRGHRVGAPKFSIVFRRLDGKPFSIQEEQVLIAWMLKFEYAPKERKSK